VHLSWVSGNYAQKTRIQYSSNTAPSTPTSPIDVYFGTGLSYIHSSQRQQGVSYYYRAWSYYSSVSTGEVYSADYAETIADFGPYYVHNKTQDKWFGDIIGALYGANAGDYLWLSGSHTFKYSSYDIDKKLIISGQNRTAKISGLNVTNVSGFRLTNVTILDGVTLSSCSYTNLKDFTTEGRIRLSNSYSSNVYRLSSNNSSSLGAIELINSFSNEVSGNVINSPTSNGIYASGANTFYNVVWWNDIYSGSKWGIYIDNSVISSNLWDQNLPQSCASGGYYV